MMSDKNPHPGDIRHSQILVCWNPWNCRVTLGVLAIGGKGTESSSLELLLVEGVLPEDGLFPEFCLDADAVDGVLVALAEDREEDRELRGVGIELESLKFDVSSTLRLLAWSGRFLAMTNFSKRKG